MHKDNEPIDRFFEKIVYLDGDELARLFGGLTGLRGRPRIQNESDAKRFGISINLFPLAPLGFNAGNDSSISISYEISDDFLLKHLLAAPETNLRNLYPIQIESKEDIDKNLDRYGIWIEGELEPGTIESKDEKQRILNIKRFDDYIPIIVDERFFYSSYRFFFRMGRLGVKKCEIFGRISRGGNLKRCCWIAPIFILDKSEDLMKPI